MLRERVWMWHEGIKRMKDLDGGQPRHLRKQPKEATAGKHKKCYQDLQEDPSAGDCNMNCHIYCWITKNDGPDIVEGSTLLKQKKKLSRSW
jgi:hypothetical protein